MNEITAAIVAALGKLAEPAVRDAYGALKDVLAKKFPRVKDAAENLERAPHSQSQRLALEEEVKELGASGYPELNVAFKALVKELGVTVADSPAVIQVVTGSSNIFSATGSVHVQRK